MNERTGLLPAIGLTLHTSGLHLLTWRLTAMWQWGVLAFTLAINIGVAAIVEERMYTGALLSIYTLVCIGFMGAMHQALSFALGFSVPRRRYHLATAWSAVVQAYLYAVILTVLLAVEQVTGGWGVDLVFFGLPFLVAGNAVAQVVVYAGPLVLLSFVGMACGLVFKRWGAVGMYALTLGSVLVCGLATLALTRPGAPAAMGEWLTAQSVLVGWGVWPLVVAVGLGVWDHRIIRRVTP
jgi:hypothetical protein